MVMTCGLVPPAAYGTGGIVTGHARARGRCGRGLAGVLRLPELRLHPGHLGRGVGELVLELGDPVAGEPALGRVLRHSPLLLLSDREYGPRTRSTCQRSAPSATRSHSCPLGPMSVSIWIARKWWPASE